MKRLLYLLLFLPLFTEAQNFIAQSNVAADVTTRRYVMNSPSNTFGNRRDVEIMLDSTSYRSVWRAYRYDFLNSSVNDGSITGGIWWGDANGNVKISPATSIPISSGQVTTALGFTPYNATNPSSYITQSGARTAISLTTTGTSGAATYNNSTGVLNVPVYAYTFSPSVTSIASGARNFNTAYQVSATNPSEIKVSSQISASLSLSGGQGGEVYLEYSANGSTGWTLGGMISGSNTGALTIGLSTVQVTGGMLSVWLPTGYYWRLRTNNTTGTPTYTFTGGTQTIF